MRKFEAARREEARRLEQIEREATKPTEPKLLLGSLGTPLRDAPLHGTSESDANRKAIGVKDAKN